MNTVLIVLVVLIVVVLFLSLLAPKNYHVVRTIVLKHSKVKVWEHIKFLKKQQEWSPWASKDPNMNQKIIGTDGQVGAISYWNGNKEVGEGEQEITSILEGKRMEQDLRFLKPFKSESKCYISLEEVDAASTKVSWGFTGDTKFPMNIMLLFKSMDKMVGNDFDKGLQNLDVILGRNEKL